MHRTQCSLDAGYQLSSAQHCVYRNILITCLLRNWQTPSGDEAQQQKPAHHAKQYRCSETVQNVSGGDGAAEHAGSCGPGWMEVPAYGKLRHPCQDLRRTNHHADGQGHGSRDSQLLEDIEQVH